MLEKWKATVGNKVSGTDDLSKVFKPLYLWLITCCIKRNTQLNKKQRVKVESSYCSWRIFLLVSNKGLFDHRSIFLLKLIMECEERLSGNYENVKTFYVVENNTKLKK